MTRLLLAFLYAVTFMGVMYASAQPDEPVAPQKFDPEKCSKSDHQCVLSWYAEYKSGILGEFEAYKKYEGQVAALIRGGNDTQAATLMGQIMRQGLYKHNHWKFATGIQAVEAGIDFTDYDTLLSDCRAAIISLKYIPIEVSEQEVSKATDDYKEYRQHALACQRRFHLPR